MMTEKFICLLASTMVMASAQADLFAALSEFRYDRRRCIVAAALFAVVCAAVCVAGTVRRNYDRMVGWTIISVEVPMLVFSFVISRYRDIRFFATYGVAAVSIAVVDFFGYLLVLLLFDGNFTVEWIVRAASVTVWDIVTHLAISDRWRRALNRISNGWWLIFLTIGGMYGLICLLAAWPTPIAQRSEAVLTDIAIIAVMALGIVMVIRMAYTMLTISEQRERSQALQAQLRLAEDQYAMLNESIRNVRHLRHDMKYHISVIYGLLNQGDYDQLRTYMNQYYDQLTLLDTAVPSYSKNQVINILAGYYARRSEDQGIECHMDIQVPESLPVNESNLVALLGNMWRNALEACEELPRDVHRFFNTIICIDGNKLIVKCKNSAPMTQQNENGSFISTKGEGHGNGLESMISIVEAYDGFYTIQVENGIFTFAAALVIK
jgi:hypothetical protein